MLFYWGDFVTMSRIIKSDPRMLSFIADIVFTVQYSTYGKISQSDRNFAVNYRTTRQIYGKIARHYTVNYRTFTVNDDIFPKLTLDLKINVFIFTEILIGVYIIWLDNNNTERKKIVSNVLFERKYSRSLRLFHFQTFEYLFKPFTKQLLKIFEFIFLFIRHWYFW